MLYNVAICCCHRHGDCVEFAGEWWRPMERLQRWYRVSQQQ